MPRDIGSLEWKIPHNFLKRSVFLHCMRRALLVCTKITKRLHNPTTFLFRKNISVSFHVPETLTGGPGVMSLAQATPANAKGVFTSQKFSPRHIGCLIHAWSNIDKKITNYTNCDKFARRIF
jgi:hypothetical protein